MVPPLGVLLQSPPNFGILYSEEEKCSLIWLFCSIFGGLSHSGKMTSLLNGRQPNAPNPKGWFWNPTSSSSENIPEPLPFVQLKYTQECCNALTISPSQYKEEDEQEVLSPGHRWSPLALLWPNPSSTSWQSHHSFLNFFSDPTFNPPSWQSHHFPKLHQGLTYISPAQTSPLCFNSRYPTAHFGTGCFRHVSKSLTAAHARKSNSNRLA